MKTNQIPNSRGAIDELSPYLEKFGILEGTLKKILIPTEDSLTFMYLDRNGHKRFAMQLVTGKIEYFGCEEQVLFRDIYDEEVIKDEQGFIRLKDMIRAQLVNKASNYFYTYDPEHRDLSICDKSSLHMIRVMDKLVDTICQELDSNL